MTAARTIPTSDIDLFSDEHLENPYPDYKALRDAGPAVHLSRLDVTALARYKAVREAVDNWETFRSGQGVSLNDLLNKAWTGTVIATDPPYHSALRGVLNERLSPRQVRKMTANIDTRVGAIVSELVERGSFDAMKDCAYRVVPNFVVDVVGFPPEGSGSEHLLGWAEEIFNVNGPADNKRMQESVSGLEKMFEWLATVATKDNVSPGGFAHAIHSAAERGDIKPESVVPLMAGYSIPGTDTTLGIIGNAIALFAQNPDQWNLVRENPDELMRPALVEVLRMDAPVQWFARVLSRDWEADGVTIEEGSRVMLLFGSGNRDERHYPDPDRFDITRDPMDHVSFGGGVHGCPGQHLAQLQANRLLRAFIDQGVTRFEITGDARRSLNNTTRSFFNLPVTVTVA
ncbi:cytochrome P450 [Pseudonocardia charpentierae]|uniref:Cytochrome P450 n=1 Tax=Pseudonocardia charpentierae TaxID=3075545 RepID=A0ABU2NIR6_9PSEU|nr:cytochrome P450 [Pseudonocardia sp. DSM 45834]MDT0353794.1 cytochrome P450 [Pseudonocardia sp. DSM 45834]